MPDVYNIYCDESCHLEHDRIDVMVLGAVWCEEGQATSVSRAMRAIKQKHGIAPSHEIKWTKVSPSHLPLYLELLEFFFADPALHFRGMIIAPKSKLSHAAFNQDHDTWYFKMYFELLKVLLVDRDSTYRIFLDIKDTRSADRVEKLHEILCNNALDYQRKMVRDIRTVRSHEIQQIQLADLLIGAIGYANRGLRTSSAKLEVVDRLRKLSGYSLGQSTSLRENKLNLFRWEPRGPQA